MADEINHPSYYNQGAIEAIDAIESACIDKPGDEAANLSHLIAYLWRYPYKGGAQSLRKARFYLDRLIALVESKEGTRG